MSRDDLLRRRFLLIIRDLSILYGDFVNEDFGNTTGGGMEKTSKAAPKKPQGKIVKSAKKK